MSTLFSVVLRLGGDRGALGSSLTGWTVEHIGSAKFLLLCIPLLVAIAGIARLVSRRSNTETASAAPHPPEASLKNAVAGARLTLRSKDLTRLFVRQTRPDANESAMSRGVRGTRPAFTRHEHRAHLNPTRGAHDPFEGVSMKRNRCLLRRPAIVVVAKLAIVATASADNLPMPVTEVAHRLEYDDFVILNSEGAGGGVMGAKKLTLQFEAEPKNITAKWKATGSAAIDNGIAFGGTLYNFFTWHYNTIRVSALPRESIERLRRVSRQDLDRMGVLAQLEPDANGVLRNVTPGPNRDPESGARLGAGGVQLGLTRAEIDAVAERLHVLLRRIDAGELAVF